MVMPQMFSVFAAYNQIFLLDDGAQPPYPEIIPQSAIDQRFQLVPYLLAIYTASSAMVSVEVSVGLFEPELDSESWSHVVFGSMSAPSGRLILAGCSDYLPECPRIAVPAGECRFILCGRGFDEGAGEEYSLFFWPGGPIEPKVLKAHAVYQS